MALIIGDVNVVDALLFGGPSQSTRDAIAREHNEFVSRVDSTWGGKLLEKTQQLFSAFNGQQTLQMVQNALNHVVSISQPDVVFMFTKTEQFQTAQPVMQAYIMANPVIRAAYHKHQCDGYSDTYVDPAPGIIGFGHEQYMHVMDGVVQMPAANDPSGDAQIVSYSAAWVSEDSQALDLQKRAALLNTWSMLERVFEEGAADPTSPWGASL